MEGQLFMTTPGNIRRDVLMHAATPLHLFECIMLAKELKSEGCGLIDLLIEQNFEVDSAIISNLEASSVFDEIRLLPTDNGITHESKRFIKEGVLRLRKNKQLILSKLPFMQNRYYDCFVMGSPTHMANLFNRAVCSNAETYLISDGLGSFDGALYTNFTFFDEILSEDFAYSRSQLAKQRAKHVINKLTGNRFCFRATRLYFLGSIPSTTCYRDIKIKRLMIEPIDLGLRLGQENTKSVYDAYKNSSVVFLGTSNPYDQNIPDHDEQCIHALKTVVDEKIIYRKHPHCTQDSLIGDGVYLDKGSILWEQLCWDSRVTNSHILVGSFSTAQFVPKIIQGYEPCIISVHNLLQLSGDEQKELDSRFENLRCLYEDQSKIFAPKTIDELRIVVEKVLKERKSKSEESLYA